MAPVVVFTDSDVSAYPVQIPLLTEALWLSDVAIGTRSVFSHRFKTLAVESK